MKRAILLIILSVTVLSVCAQHYTRKLGAPTADTSSLYIYSNKTDAQAEIGFATGVDTAYIQYITDTVNVVLADTTFGTEYTVVSEENDLNYVAVLHFEHGNLQFEFNWNDVVVFNAGQINETWTTVNWMEWNGEQTKMHTNLPYLEYGFNTVAKAVLIEAVYTISETFKITKSLTVGTIKGESGAAINIDGNVNVSGAAAIDTISETLFIDGDLIVNDGAIKGKVSDSVLVFAHGGTLWGGIENGSGWISIQFQDPDQFIFNSLAIDSVFYMSTDTDPNNANMNMAIVEAVSGHTEGIIHFDDITKIYTTTWNVHEGGRFEIMLNAWFPNYEVTIYKDAKILGQLKVSRVDDATNATKALVINESDSTIRQYEFTPTALESITVIDTLHLSGGMNSSNEFYIDDSTGNVTDLFVVGDSVQITGLFEQTTFYGTITEISVGGNGTYFKLSAIPAPTVGYPVPFVVHPVTTKKLVKYQGNYSQNLYSCNSTSMYLKIDSEHGNINSKLKEHGTIYLYSENWEMEPNPNVETFVPTDTCFDGTNSYAASQEIMMTENNPVDVWFYMLEDNEDTLAFKTANDQDVDIRGRSSFDFTPNNGTVPTDSVSDFYKITANNVVLTTGTIADNDTSPDVTGASVWTYNGTVNSVTLTDLDNPVIGQAYTIIGNSDAYTISITDGGNFNISSNWTGGIDDVITIYVIADNRYIEFGDRIDN